MQDTITRMKSNPIRSVTLAIALLLLLAWPIAPAEGRASLEAASNRQLAPDFSAKDAEGAPFKLSDYRGQVVLLDFWATWCHGCKTEIPWYIEFHDKYKDRGLSVVGISMDESWTPVWPFLTRQNVNYRVAVGDDKLAGLYKVRELPVTLLIDRSGRIADAHVGVVDKDTFEKEIQALLQE